MAEELTFKQKMLKMAYGMGLKGTGDTLLAELRKGSPEWMSFAQELLAGTDYPRRKVIVQQLCSKGFAEKHKSRERLLAMILDLLGSKISLGDEKKAALKFVEQNLALFPTEDDGFRGKILALQRERDTSLSSAATALLPKIGVNMDDRELYRRS